MVEQALEWYQRIHGLRVAVLRGFNAAGAAGTRGEAHRPETHLVPLVLQVALGKRREIAIFGDDYPTPASTCVRDYIHIEDLATAHVLALGGLAEQPFMRFNLGNGAGYSVREVIESARRVTGQPIPAVIHPRRAGDPAILIASNDGSSCPWRSTGQPGSRSRCSRGRITAASSTRWISGRAITSIWMT